MSVINLNEEQVLELLDWPLVFDAVEQSLRSICETKVSEDQPTAKQPTRIFTPIEKGTINEWFPTNSLYPNFIIQFQY